MKAFIVLGIVMLASACVDSDGVGLVSGLSCGSQHPDGHNVGCHFTDQFCPETQSIAMDVKYMPGIFSAAQSQELRCPTY